MPAPISFTKKSLPQIMGIYVSFGSKVVKLGRCNRQEKSSYCRIFYLRNSVIDVWQICHARGCWSKKKALKGSRWPVFVRDDHCNVELCQLQRPRLSVECLLAFGKRDLDAKHRDVSEREYTEYPYKQIIRKGRFPTRGAIRPTSSVTEEEEAMYPPLL